MEAHVNENLCIGCGLCYDLCPEVFGMNEKAHVIVSTVPEDLLILVKEAAKNCPVEAIVTS